MKTPLTLDFSIAATVAIAVMTLAAPADTIARRYQAGMLWDLKGPVKEVKIDSPFKMADKKIRFSEDGHMKNRKMSYDEACRPVGYELKDGDAYIRLNVSYDPEGRISRITHVGSNGEQGECSTVFTFHGDGRKVDSVNMLSQAPEGEMAMDLAFDNYIYDTHGNWVSRSVSLKRTAPGVDPQTANFTETRSIKYYEE
ncbi:MAG: hypothetical protein K2I48_09170 [Muribaculaceae bacterium]|nr:hypothetical protein [Muribaculaceae bacterium]